MKLATFPSKDRRARSPRKRELCSPISRCISQTFSRDSHYKYTGRSGSTAENFENAHSGSRERGEKKGGMRNNGYWQPCNTLLCKCTTTQLRDISVDYHSPRVVLIRASAAQLIAESPTRRPRSIFAQPPSAIKRYYVARNCR